MLMSPLTHFLSTAEKNLLRSVLALLSRGDLLALRSCCHCARTAVSLVLYAKCFGGGQGAAAGVDHFHVTDEDRRRATRMHGLSPWQTSDDAVVRAGLEAQWRSPNPPSMCLNLTHFCEQVELLDEFSESGMVFAGSCGLFYDSLAFDLTGGFQGFRDTYVSCFCVVEDQLFFGTDTGSFMWVPSDGFGQMSVGKKAHRHEISAIKYHPGTTRIVSVGEDGNCCIWDCERAADCGPTQSTRKPGSRRKKMHDVLWLDENVLALCGGTFLYTYDCREQSAKLSDSFPQGDTGHTYSIYTLAHDGSGSLFSGGGDGLINSWDIRTRSIVERVYHHKEFVYRIQYSGNKLFGLSRDGRFSCNIIRGERPNSSLLWDHQLLPSGRAFHVRMDSMIISGDVGLYQLVSMGSM